MKTYLMFLQNLQSGEEFVAPVTASGHDEALMVAGEKYPPRLYKMQTFYTLADMERIIADVKRWPGVATSVQPLMEQINRRVAAGSNLPPLQAEPALAPSALPAFLTMPRAAAAGPRAAAPAPQQTAPVMSAIDAIRALKNPAGISARMEVTREAPVAPAPLPAPARAAAPATPAKRTVSASIISRTGSSAPSASVLDVLKALRQ